MSITATVKTNRPYENPYTVRAKATLRLRRRLENSLIGHGLGHAERRFVKSMIDLLYCVSIYDRDTDVVIESVRNLTSKRRLQAAFSNSGCRHTPGHESILLVPNPSERV